MNVSYDSMFKVSISDTGQGIKAEELPRIFDRFYQAKGNHQVIQGGTGLGLAISKQFAEMLGGDISVFSVPNQGSTFTLRLPKTLHVPIESAA